MIPALRSPVTGALLQPDGPALLRDADGRRWPLLDGIPYLRTGRDALVEAAVAAVERGDADRARVLLLADQDDWWTGAVPDEDALRTLVAGRNRLSLRDAMGLLAFGRVGDYFAHRWSDPTFLAGLALLDAHRRPADSAFELACGIGHYGRELARRGVAFTGADVVFAKLWLARHWVLGEAASLVCFDAASPWPLPREPFDLAFCHDAFYFLEPKPAILAELRARVAPGGRLALSHIHNSGADNLSAGRAVSPEQLAAFFPRATVYDDAELTAALVEARAPRPAPLAVLGRVEAFSVEDGPNPAAHADPSLALPPRDASLRLNPLYAATPDGVSVRWPSPRYEAEYAPRATFPASLSRGAVDALDPEAPAPAAGSRTAGAAEALRLDAIRRRILVDLPERW